MEDIFPFDANSALPEMTLDFGPWSGYATVTGDTSDVPEITQQGDYRKQRRRCAALLDNDTQPLFPEGETTVSSSFGTPAAFGGEVANESQQPLEGTGLFLNTGSMLGRTGSFSAEMNSLNVLPYDDWVQLMAMYETPAFGGSGGVGVGGLGGWKYQRERRRIAA